MNNKIIAKDNTATEVEKLTPSDKTINWLIKNSINTTDTPEENYRKLAEAVWKEATRKSVKRVKLETIITDYAQSKNSLLTRIYEARTVIRNTLKKMTHGSPSELNWARSWNDDLQLLGIFEINPVSGGRDKNITYAIQNGTMELSPSHLIKFTHQGYNGVQECSIAAKYLNGDPMALAQMVRKESRQYAVSCHKEILKAFDKEKAELKKKMEYLQSSIDLTLNEKPMKTKRVPKPYLASIVESVTS